MSEPAPVPEDARGGVRRRSSRVAVGALYLAAWFVLALLATLTVFLSSARTTTLASHDVVLRPTLSGKAVVHTGPVLPDLRMDSGSFIGVDIALGKTDVTSLDALLERYAVIASQPEGQQDKARGVIASMAFDAMVRGAILGLVPILVWALVGSARRRELLERFPTKQGAFATALVMLIGLGLWEPWAPHDLTVEADRSWEAIKENYGNVTKIRETIKRTTPLDGR